MGTAQIIAIVVSVISYSMGYIVAAQERGEERTSLGTEMFLDQRFRVSVGVTALILLIGSLVYLGLSRWWLPFVVFFAAVALSFVIQKLVLLLVILPMHKMYSWLTREQVGGDTHPGREDKALKKQVTMKRWYPTFCRNCGKELIGIPEFCPNCGARPMRGNSFCSNCGAYTTPLTEICPKCGVRVVGKVEAEQPKKVLRILCIVLLGILIFLILVGWMASPIPIYYRLLAPSGWLLIGAVIGIVFLARKGRKAKE